MEGTCCREGNALKLLLREDRVAMSASDDSKVVVRDRSDNRAIWVRPTLRRLAANKAEGHSSPVPTEAQHPDRS